MKADGVRTTVDIPGPLYRKLKRQAAAEGRSARELILRGLEQVVFPAQRPETRRVHFPLIRSKGRKVALSQERIYEYVEFP